MKILKFKGKMTQKNKLLIIFAALFVIALITISIIYAVNENAREWINVNILRKEVTEEDVASIVIDTDKSQYIYAYDKYIAILCNGKLEIYNSFASKITELEIQVSNPMFSANGAYLTVAENGGQRIYLISDTKMQWESKVEGNINKISVSKNGDVSVVTKGTSYKSVIVTFDKGGKELFKTYLASTIAVSTDVSADGKYLAIAEVNTSGAVIESSIKIIEINKAKSGDTTNSVVYKYNADTNKIITEIKYQDKGQLVCIYDDSVHIIYQDADNVLKEFNSNVQIADINLKGHFVRTEEISAGLFSSKTDVIITNISNGTETTYTLDSAVKKIVSYDQSVAINLGTEVHFIGLNGWLEKRYKSAQEIKNVVVGSSVAGIIYRDRVKIVTL